MRRKPRFVVKLLGAVLLAAFVVLYLVSYATTGGHPMQTVEEQPSTPASKSLRFRCPAARGHERLAKKICAELRNSP